MTLDDTLFPEIEPFDQGMLDVGQGHRVWYEQCGNPQGRPLLFLHGGPGAGCKPRHRRYYDPSVWRIVLLDQRGCGRSTPRDSVAHNTTQHLLGDLEQLRQHLGIARWAVCGGSWGSFLSLAYAQAHPEACLGLVLRGIFTGRKLEQDWWWEGVRWIHPEAWEALRDALPEPERDAVLSAYARRLANPDPAVHGPAALAFGRYNAATLLLHHDDAIVNAAVDMAQALTVGRLFSHYCLHGCFVPEGALIAGVERIRHLPALIVQGRYDVATPMRNAWDLARAWPEAELVTVHEGAHSMEEPPMAQALVAAQQRLAQRLDAAQPR